MIVASVVPAVAILAALVAMRDDPRSHLPLQRADLPD